MYWELRGFSFNVSKWDISFISYCYYFVSELFDRKCVGKETADKIFQRTKKKSVSNKEREKKSEINLHQ